MRGFWLLRMVRLLASFLLPPLSSLINIVGVARVETKGVKISASPASLRLLKISRLTLWETPTILEIELGSTQNLKIGWLRLNRRGFTPMTLCQKYGFFLQNMSRNVIKSIV